MENYVQEAKAKYLEEKKEFQSQAYEDKKKISELQQRVDFLEQKLSQQVSTASYHAILRQLELLQTDLTSVKQEKVVLATEKRALLEEKQELRKKLDAAVDTSAKQEDQLKEEKTKLDQTLLEIQEREKKADEKEKELAEREIELKKKEDLAANQTISDAAPKRAATPQQKTQDDAHVVEKGEVEQAKKIAKLPPKNRRQKLADQQQPQGGGGRVQPEQEQEKQEQEPTIRSGRPRRGSVTDETMVGKKSGVTDETMVRKKSGAGPGSKSRSNRSLVKVIAGDDDIDLFYSPRSALDKQSVEQDGSGDEKGQQHAVNGIGRRSLRSRTSTATARSAPSVTDKKKIGKKRALATVTEEEGDKMKENGGEGIGRVVKEEEPARKRGKTAGSGRGKASSTASRGKKSAGSERAGKSGGGRSSSKSTATKQVERKKAKK